MISRFLRRSGVIMLVIALAFSSFVQIAYAEVSEGGSFDDDQIIFGPTVYNTRSEEYSILVYSGTSYNAALVALGYNPYDAKFTSDVKAYLSDNTTGGSFYEFANLFTNQRPDLGVTLGNSTFVSSWTAALALYPENNLFGAIYTEALANSAKQRVEDILAGDVTGGSGGGSGGGYEGDFVAPDSVTLTMSDYVGTENTSVKRYSQNYVTPRPNPYNFPLECDFTVALGDTVKQLLNATGSTYKYATYMLCRNNAIYEGYGTDFYIFLTENEPEIDVAKNLVVTGKSYWVRCTTSNVQVNGHNNLTLVSNDSPITRTSGTYVENFSLNRVAYVVGGSGSEPVVPPSNWPDNPTVVAPSPPELPEPRDPVIPNPPSDPVPTDPPTYITQPTYNVSVFTADLQGILDAMDEHCIHLQNALYTDLNALYNKLASTITEDNQKTRTLISNRFTWLGNVISECLDTLNDNLYDYFHWLAEQFDFESSGGYNDSTVVAWLKKIYAKLGGGSPVNPKPVDPVSDPFDFGKWLSDLWNTFIADLIAIGAEGMAAIADDLQQLIHKFPFSIPWDIAAMLALLVAEPQTPVIQWPMFTYNGSGVQVVQTTIDLTPYNNYVEPVRVMIKIGFAAVLAWRTKDMLELLTMARGGNNA